MTGPSLGVGVSMAKGATMRVDFLQRHFLYLISKQMNVIRHKIKSPMPEHIIMNLCFRIYPITLSSSET